MVCNVRLNRIRKLMKGLRFVWMGWVCLSVAVVARADEKADAVAKIEALGGQVLQIANNAPGVRVLIPHKTADGRELSDADLASLVHLENVEELDVKWANITDNGLEPIGKLTDLKRLHLEKTKITDAGLKQVGGLKNLEYLNLYGTAVTDAGLEHLSGLTNLKKLFLWDTKVTEDGAAKFHASMQTAGANRLDINLGWGKELLNAETLAHLAEQRAKAEAAAAAAELAAAAEAAKQDPTIATFLLSAVDSENQQKLLAAAEAERAKLEAAVKAAEAEKAAALAAVNNPGFTQDVLPILEARCVECHGEEKQKEELRLDSLVAVLRGSEHGPIVVSGKPEESSLYKRISLPPDHDDIMPPKGDPLTETEVTLIQNWIKLGAPEARPAAVEVAADVVENPTFDANIVGIFKERCVDCHGPEKQKAKLRLDSLVNVLRGSGDGAIVVARKSGESSLVERISLPAGHDDIMPPKGDPLTAAQIDLIKKWIDQGVF